MFGDSGADIFVFGAGHGNDTIYDFTSGEDKIELTFDDISRFDDLTITSSHDGVTIDLTRHGGGTIFLAGLALADLSAEDFIFNAGWVFGTETGETLRGAYFQPNKIDGLEGDDIIHGGVVTTISVAARATTISLVIPTTTLSMEVVATTGAWAITARIRSMAAWAMIG